MTTELLGSGFGFRASSFLRHSSFGFRHSPALCACAIRAALAWVVLWVLAPPLGASVVPGETAAPADVRKDERGCSVVTDAAHGFRLRMPAAYWECKTPAQLLAESGAQAGGCAGASGGGVPPSLMLLVRHKDAPAAVSLELQQDRFLLRGKEDLENYMNGRLRILMERGGKALELEKSSYEERAGMIVHRAVFRAQAQDKRQKYLLVDFFVRPEGEDARLYEMACFSTEEAYADMEAEFEQFVGNFEFIGKPAATFFAPDAPLERLPSLDKLQQRGSACGGAYAGMMIAVLVVFAVYMYWTYRRKQQQSGF